MATMADTSAFFTILTHSPQTFLQPSVPLYTDTLTYLKHALDPIASDISQTQHERRQETRKKRKRGSHAAEEEILRLKQIHTEGFTVEQVWEQSRRVIEAAVGEVERNLEHAHTSVQSQNRLGAVDDDDDSSLGDEGVDYEVEGPDADSEEWNEENDFSDTELIDAPGASANDEDIEIGDEDSDLEADLLGNEETSEEFVPDKFGLNDGFFSIDDFNRKSEFLEQQDVRGEDDGAASDEEELDWDADPLGQALGGINNVQSGNEAQDDEKDDEEGPTFGDPDAPSEDEEDELMDGELNEMGDMANTNHIMYADFFAPPAQQKKKRKNKKGRPNPHNFPEQGTSGTREDNEVEEEEDMERTMAAVHRDLFDDEESEPESDDVEAGGKRSGQDSNRSTHEKRRAALANEIRQLEAAAVAKRSWTLSGEAKAADRPINSLLEEDLEFERAGKPVPVITAEVSESIEDLIKRRILAYDFQDIPRRRPDDLVTGKDARRGRQDFILDDKRSKKGLAEEYEEEHLRRNDPNFVDAKDAKTKKEEEEILALWKKVSADLDGLSSWHFRPRAPAPTLSILVDAPAIAVEDARPSAGGEVSGASQLAPQEVYRAGEGTEGVRNEVVGKSGLPSAREEVAREDKKRRRRREKERSRKAGTSQPSGGVKTGSSKSVEERKRVVGDLKKGGVGVIGKTGDVTDVAGREMKSGEKVQVGGGGRFKL